MVMEHKTSFIVKRNINEIFDMAINYFQSQGFALESSDRPNHLVFDKKGTIWTTTIRKMPQKLHIYLSEKSAGTVSVIFHFVSKLSGYASPVEYEKLNTDILVFKDLILTTLPEQTVSVQMPSQQPQQLPQPRGTSPITQLQYCPFCSNKIQSDWKVCGFCGRKLGG